MGREIPYGLPAKINHQLGGERDESSDVELGILVVVGIAVIAVLAMIISSVAATIEVFTNDAPGFIVAISSLRIVDAFAAEVASFAETSVGNYLAPTLIALCVGAVLGTALSIGADKIDRSIFLIWTIGGGCMAALGLIVGLTGGISPLLPHLALVIFGFFTGWIGSFWIGTGIAKSL